MGKAKTLTIQVRDRGGVLAHSCVHAHSALSRLIGLLNHSKLNPGEALLLEPCNQVHTFFMRFSIDAVFLDKKNTVIAIHELRPWRLSKLYFKARKVLELPLGTCRQHQLAVGENLELRPC